VLAKSTKLKHGTKLGRTLCFLTQTPSDLLVWFCFFQGRAKKPHKHGTKESRNGPVQQNSGGGLFTPPIHTDGGLFTPPIHTDGGLFTPPIHTGGSEEASGGGSAAKEAEEAEEEAADNTAGGDTGGGSSRLLRVDGGKAWKRILAQAASPSGITSASPCGISSGIPPSGIASALPTGISPSGISPSGISFSGPPSGIAMLVWTASWCSSCTALLPLLELAAAQARGLVSAICDADEVGSYICIYR